MAWETSRPCRATTTRPGVYHHQSLAEYRRIDDQWGVARVLSDLAGIDLQAGNYAAAMRSLKQALRAFHAVGHQRGVARQLELLSWCAGCQVHDRDAVMLASAAAALRERIGTPAKPAELDKIERTLAAARNRISAKPTPGPGMKAGPVRSIGS